MHTKLVAVFIAVALGVSSPGWAAQPSAPEGYREDRHAVLAPGVTHRALSLPGHQSVNVAHIGAGAPVALRTVSSHDTITGRNGALERTSSMCARTECIVGINGDFFAAGGVPVGAVVSGAELLRTQPGKHHALMLRPDGTLRAGTLNWSGTLMATDLTAVELDGINVPRRNGELVLYTPAFGRSTRQNRHGAELVIRFAKDRAPRVGETAVVRLERFRFGEGDTRIPADGAVLSGHGKQAEALRALWRRVQRDVAGREALLRIESRPAAVEAIGGSPILLRDGTVWFADENRAFVRTRAPRTLVGWNDEGDVWLVTVDGRQPGYANGMSLSEAANLMLSLGATDAINLDGGGSTTFTVGGAVVNRPSDRLLSSGGVRRIATTAPAGVAAPNVERPVANALVVVPRARAGTEPVPPRLDLDLPEANTVPLPTPSETDPASNPDAALPAIVLEPLAVVPAAREATRVTPVTFALLLNLLVGATVLGAVRARARVWLDGLGPPTQRR